MDSDVQIRCSRHLNYRHVNLGGPFVPYGQTIGWIHGKAHTSAVMCDQMKMKLLSTTYRQSDKDKEIRINEIKRE